MSSTSIKSVVNDFLDSSKGVLSQAQLVSQLSQDKELYRLALHAAAEKILELEKTVKEQTEKFEKFQQASVPLTYLAEKIKKQFYSGNIPLPDMLGLNKTRTVDVFCVAEDINFSFGGDSVAVANVSFQSNTMAREGYSFKLILVPCMPVNQDAYPNFHMGYTKVAPAKKRVRVRKTKVETTLPPADVTSLGREVFRKELKKL